MLSVNITTNITIPRIVHQIAPRDKDLWHPFWFKCQQSWLDHFNDCEYILWNDREEIDNFVHKNYPEFSNLYNLFPVHIMKIDFVRLCFLHKFGGIYADMDYFVYKNFYDKLEKNVGFIENLTNEYTTAQFENSLMYSEPENPFLYELMKYTKTCFIHHRSLFKKNSENWRSVENDKLVNNTTGSGMISTAVEHFKKYFNIGFLKCRLFNNRPGAYDKEFFGKHVHSSIWGNEYSVNKPDHLLIKNGLMYNMFGNAVDNLPNLTMPYEIIHMENFDFYKDYTNGVYLKENNLEEIKQYIKDLF